MKFKDFLLIEKWGKDVEIESTGKHADKTVSQLRKEVEELKGKQPFTEKDKKLMGQLLFAIRAKTGWKKGEGAAGL